MVLLLDARLGPPASSSPAAHQLASITRDPLADQLHTLDDKRRGASLLTLRSRHSSRDDHYAGIPGKDPAKRAIRIEGDCLKVGIHGQTRRFCWQGGSVMAAKPQDIATLIDGDGTLSHGQER
jgi:hypothetical protein